MHFANRFEIIKAAYIYISCPLPSLPLPVTRTPRSLASTICLCNYVSDYKCMYMYTAVVTACVHNSYRI